MYVLVVITVILKQNYFVLSEPLTYNKYWCILKRKKVHILQDTQINVYNLEVFNFLTFKILKVLNSVYIKKLSLWCAKLIIMLQKAKKAGSLFIQF